MLEDSIKAISFLFEPELYPSLKEEFDEIVAAARKENQLSDYSSQFEEYWTDDNNWEPYQCDSNEICDTCNPPKVGNKTDE